MPNQATAARHILKDYVNGVLVFAKRPPTYQEKEEEKDESQQFKKKNNLDQKEVIELNI